MASGAKVPVSVGVVSVVVCATTVGALGAAVSTANVSVSLAVPTLPAASWLLTLASITLSLSAAKSAPGTGMLKPLLLTRPVKVLPLMVKVTVSPLTALPPTMPVMLTLPAASAALSTSSGVMLALRLMVGAGAVLSNKTSPAVLSVLVLPAASVTETVMS